MDGVKTKIDEYANISKEARDSAKKTCWPEVNIQDVYAFGWQDGYDTLAAENKKLREELEQDNQFLSKQNKMLEKAIESARIEKGNLEQELTSTKSKIAEVNAENDRLFNRLSDFAFEHPLYKLSKELEKENKELEEELRVTKSQLDESLDCLVGALCVLDNEAMKDSFKEFLTKLKPQTDTRVDLMPGSAMNDDLIPESEKVKK